MSQKTNFFAKIKRTPNGCIEWTGAKRGGYGVIQWGNSHKQATHVSWFLKFGVWPVKHILHHCDNPSCVKISHLFEGDDLDNARDRDAKGRHRSLRGEAAPNARLTEVEVRKIIDLGQTTMRVEEIGQQFNIPTAHVSNILRGHSWKHIPRPVGSKPIAKHKDATLVDFYGELLTARELSERSGIGQQTILKRIQRGLTGEELIAPPHRTKRKEYTRKK